MPRHLLFALSAAALLASCGGEKRVDCDADGLIIIPADASQEDRDKWMTENADLAFNRVMRDTGNRRPRSGTLSEAPSCS